MVFFDDDALLDRALTLRAWGRSSEKWMWGTVLLEDSGITSGVIFSGNITRHPMLRGYEYRMHHPDGLGRCDQIMEHGIMLPCHPTMTREDCEYVYQTLTEFIEANGQP